MTTIIPYQHDIHHAHFVSINERWIKKYFGMEQSDINALHHAKSYILDKGGHIVMAELNGEIVGTCALIKMEHPDYDFELAKMGVTPAAQGKGAGLLLGQAVIEKARSLGAKRIYLESNSVLESAIRLYRKLGFVDVKGVPSPYCRCNVQMELVL